MIETLIPKPHEAASASSETDDSARFRELFDNAPVFLAVGTQPDFRFEYANKAYEKLVDGYDLVGRTVAEAIPELAAQGFIKIFNEVYLSGKAQTGRDMLIKVRMEPDAPREERYVDFIYQPIIGPTGAGTSVLCVGFDVSEQHESREQVGRLQGALHHASRIGAMGTMAATLAHELNQPLTAAANYLAASRRLLCDAPDGANDERVLAALDETEKQIRRAGEIIRRARSMVSSKLAAREAVALEIVVAHALELIKVVAGCGHAIVRTDLQPEHTMLLVDPIQTEQVFLNLIRNACQAMMECPRRELTIRSRILDDGFAEIRLSDTGRGLSNEGDVALFTAFADATEGGLGIGLSISRTIVEAHGGRMWALNNPQAGATFCFTLPLAAAHEA